MASIQGRHSRACALARSWAPFAVSDGCTCEPTYYVVVREGRRLHRERVGKNRKLAERALRKIGAQVDDGEYRPQQNIRFRDWADRWLASLERKETTKDSYRSTVAWASKLLGEKVVRRLRTEDIARFNAHLRERGISASTRAKHLRVLGACLHAAVAHGYAAGNPVRDLPKAERPRPHRKEDEELIRLYAEVPDGLFRDLFEVALKTGMRQGELLALTWGDVDLGEAVIRVRRSVTDGYVSLPKNHERRDVDLTADVVELLGAWWGECERPLDGVLVFPADAGGYLTPSTILRRELYPAMKRAELPREGPTGEKRTFHSLRHTFARVALEHGADLTWLQRHLGHSSLAVTVGIYGHWSRAQRKAQTRRLEGVFAV
jgi:integrase